MQNLTKPKDDWDKLDERIATMKKRRSFRLRYDKTLGLLLVSPWLIGFILFKLLPILASFVLSFTDFYMLEPGATKFIGFSNYIRMFRDSPIGFLIVATLNIAIRTIPLQLIASILLAALLNSSRLKAPILTECTWIGTGDFRTSAYTILRISAGNMAKNRQPLPFGSGLLEPLSSSLRIRWIAALCLLGLRIPFVGRLFPRW
jgi:hypothetical protein